MARPRPEALATVRAGAGGRVHFLRLLGPALLVSVGYLDPGNWATDLEGGARFGYELLWVLVVSNAMALLLQGLCVRLGLGAGVDLATACRQRFSRRVALCLWLLAEVAIVACDVAELVGSAVALHLLFGVPVLVGAALTTFDVLLLLGLTRRGSHSLELFVFALVAVIAVTLGIEVALARPDAAAMARGLVPHLEGKSLYVALGMLGATVMPHNLYLQSALVRRRPAPEEPAEQRRHLRRTLLGTALALNLALLLNAAILVLAAAAFSSRGLPIADLGAAHGLLAPVLGTSLASALFAVGLLCSGQSATITGTLAGQIVMEGFIHFRISPLARRLLTRALAVVPAMVVLAWFGADATMALLVGSQVVLSLQLPFAMVPLLRLTSSGAVMGPHVTGIGQRLLATGCALVITAANAVLVVRVIADLRGSARVAADVLAVLAVVALALLAWVSVVPLRGEIRAKSAYQRARAQGQLG